MFTRLLYRFINFKSKSITFKKRKFRIMIADSVLKQILGLMHRPKLLADEGMLFIFKNSGRQGIWMLNMNFPIDCIWLNDSGKVIDIANNIQPCNGMLGCKTFIPASNSKYVLEITAGLAGRLKIAKGTNLSAFVK